MISSAQDLQRALKHAMLNTVIAQRIVDQACRTKKAAEIGKCIDMDYVYSHIEDMGIKAPRAVIDDLFLSLDPDSDGVVDFHAFLKGICGSQSRDFILSMRNLISKDTVRETKLRKTERQRRLQEAAATEISDPFELLRSKIKAKTGSDSFRKVFQQFRVRSASHVTDETIDFRGFKHVLAQLNINLSERKMRLVFNTIDKDGSRMIDFSEFQAALTDEARTKSNVKDWQQRVAESRWKQQQAYEDVANLIRSPKALYVLLRNMFAGQANPTKSFRNFLRLSSSTDSLVDVGELKKCLNAKQIKYSPFVVERLFKHLDPDNDGRITFSEFTKAFIDIDLAQLHDLDLPPPEIRKFNKAKPRPRTVDTDTAMNKLRDEMRKRGTMRGLQLAFHRNRCTWKAIKGGVDLRGFMLALDSKGLTLPTGVIKSCFFHLDQKNTGVVTYAQFRNAVQDVVPSGRKASPNKSMWTNVRAVGAAGNAAAASHKRRNSATNLLQRSKSVPTKEGTIQTGPDGSSTRSPVLPHFSTYNKRDLNVALAATQFMRARKMRQQKNNAIGSIYRNPYE